MARAYFKNIAVWDLTDLETGGGTIVYGVVTMLGTGSADFTGSLEYHGSVSITGTASTTWTSSGVILGSVDITGTGTFVVAGIAAKNELLSENLTLDDILASAYIITGSITDKYVVADYLFPTGYFNNSFIDGFTTDDQLTSYAVARIVEKITANDTLGSSSSFHVFAVCSASLADQIYVAFPTNILENVTLDDQELPQAHKLVTILSRVAVGDLPGSQVYFTTGLGEVLTLDDIMVSGGLEALIESLTGDDSLSSTLVSSVVNLEAMELSEALSTILSMYHTEIVGLELDDANATMHTGHYLVEDDIKVGTIFEELNVSAWTMNPEIYAVSTYNMGFTESSVFGNDYLLADDSGLYLLGGNSDDGDAIVSTITTASLDFGAETLKQVPSVLLGTNGTDVVLKVSIDGKNTVFYELSGQTSTLDTKHIKIGKGLIGNNWQFSLITQDNSDLDLDSFEFYPIVLKRKHNG